MTGGCHCDREHIITDRNHIGLRLSPNGLCGTVIYNCQPIYLADKLIELKETAQGVVLLFTDESPEACKRIALEFTEAVPPERPKEYTRGHFSRGV